MTRIANFKTAKVVSIFLAVFLGATSSAHALTLDEQNQYNEWNGFFQSSEGHSSLVQQKCGITVPVKLDPAFTTPFMPANDNAGAYCDAALDAIAQTCDKSEAGKTAVASKIHSLSCIYTSNPTQQSLKLNDAGELQYTFGIGATNQVDEVIKFLGSNL